MSQQSASHDELERGAAGGVQVHIVPPRVLLAVFASLIVLTALTYGVTYVDLGALNLWVAIGIAALKATLVALWFMHLRYDRLFHGFVFLAAIAFVFLFIGLAMMDTAAYRPDVIPDFAPSIQAPR
jgi:cytochrome c oxidase subunit 4